MPGERPATARLRLADTGVSCFLCGQAFLRWVRRGAPRPRLWLVVGATARLPGRCLSPSPSTTTNRSRLVILRQTRWEAIQSSGELRRMSRTHVHFATRPNQPRANNWATVRLLLDLRGAVGDSLEFFR